jgi:predicted house-cleaning noncanonical NTP pyrophosphatase (MazG superfamily)
MEKLVRDKIPEIIKQKGEECVVRVAESNEEYEKFLLEKLMEEGKEFCQAKDISQKLEEMADLSEVIKALFSFYKFDANVVENIRIQKLEKRGGFEKRIIWKDTVGYYKNKEK